MWSDDRWTYRIRIRILVLLSQYKFTRKLYRNTSQVAILSFSTLLTTSVCFSDSLDLPIISRNYFDKEWEVGGGCKFWPIYLRFVDFAAIFATPLAVTKHICACEIARASANAHNERPLSSSKSKIPRTFESRNVGGTLACLNSILWAWGQVCRITVVSWKRVELKWGDVKRTSMRKSKGCT